MHYGEIYTGHFENQAETLALDMFEIVAPADAVLVIHSLHLVQHLDLGDAEEEQLRMEWLYGFTTSGSAGVSLTMNPRNKGASAFGGTVEATNTTVATVTTPTDDGIIGWNVRVPLDKIYTPEQRKIISPGDRLVLRVLTAPTDSLSLSGEITIEEIGG